VQNAHTERVYLSSTAGALGAALFHAPDAPSGTPGRTRVFLALPDSLGSPAFFIDKETSELVEHATYEAAGTAEADFRPDRWGSFRYQYRHTGHVDDSEIGLVNFGARYYAPMLGRWLSPDPLAVHAMAGDLNPYRFVRGSPLRLVDPIGADDCDVLSPGCGGFSETFPSDPEVGIGPAQGIGGNFSATGSGPRGSSVQRPPPRPPDPGVPIEAFDSPAGVLALATGQPNVQVDLPGGYHINTTRHRIAAANALSAMALDTALFSPSGRLLGPVLESLKASIRIDAGAPDDGDISDYTGPAAVFAGSLLIAPGSALKAESGFNTVSRVAELKNALGSAEGFVTMAVGVAEDANGARQVLIGTSEEMGYLRPDVIATLKPGEIVVRGLGHAEEDIVFYAQQNGLKLLEVGATRPICGWCAFLIQLAGATPVTPLKVLKVP
jgi:RHS repeat-associated protein